MPEMIAINPWLLALAIFLARVGDVTLGTFRTIVIFRGYGLLAAAIGFVEILLWIAAASQVLTNLVDWYLAIAYAAGFAAGNYVGIWLESRVAMGDELVRAISFRRDSPLGDALRAAGFNAIEMEGDMGTGKPVEVMLVAAKRKRVPELVRLIRATDPDALYTINDIKHAYTGAEKLIRKPLFFSGWRVRGKRK